jgi:hypothetical protein
MTKNGPRSIKPEKMWMAGACGLERADIANGRLYVPVHNVKQRRTL